MPTAQPLSARVFDTDRRRTDRAQVALDTLMVDREGRTIAVTIVNLSEKGFMAVIDAPLCQRAPVRIDVPTIGWLRADIVWVLGERIGAAFREPIDQDAYGALVRIFG